MADKYLGKRHLLEELSLDKLEGVSGGVLPDSLKSELARDYAALKREGYTKQEIIDYYTEPGGIFPVGTTLEDFLAYVDEVWDTL